MKRTAIIIVALLSAGVASATTKSLQLPPDAVQLKPNALPGYALAQSQCVACH